MIKWWVYLFPPPKSVLGATPAASVHFHLEPRHCRLWGSKGPCSEVAWHGHGLLVWKWDWAMLGNICSLKPANDSSHSHQPHTALFRGLTAIARPWKALTWIRLVANPIVAQLHKLMDHWPLALLTSYTTFQAQSPLCKLPSSARFVFRWFSFLVNCVKRI